MAQNGLAKTSPAINLPTLEPEALRILAELVNAVVARIEPKQLRPDLKRLDELLGRPDEVP
jgi:hypothetical protein